MSITLGDGTEHTPDSNTVDLVQTLLTAQISNIGYPVGCGNAPHPETVRRMAEYCVTICETICETDLRARFPREEQT